MLALNKLTRLLPRAWQCKLTRLEAKCFRVVAALRRRDGNDYSKWVKTYDKSNRPGIHPTREDLLLRSNRPRFLILLTAEELDQGLLAGSIRSVVEQLYPEWSLYVVYRSTVSRRVHRVLQRWVRRATRIRSVLLPEGVAISQALNSIMEEAEASWVTLLNSGDRFRRQTLLRFADSLDRHPVFRVLYADSDSLDPRGRRVSPNFKPDWNLDLLYSQNYLRKPIVFSLELLKALGGFRTLVGDAKEYDVLLRIAEHVSPNQIGHLPGVLYHERIHDTATEEKRAEEEVRALRDHFQRSGRQVVVTRGSNARRVSYPVPEPTPVVSLIIPTRNGLTFLSRCVTSILKATTYSRFEIIIVDNNSDDPELAKYFAVLETDVRVRVISDNRPFNYSALNNGAVKVARGSILGLLNNDIEVISPDWLTEMVSLAVQPRIGAVGAKLWYSNDTLQHGGIVLGLTGGVAGHAHKHLAKGEPGYQGRANLVQSFSAVTGACLVVRKEVYDQVGGLDEENLKIAFNDVDFCLRAREAGFTNVWTPYAELYHHESATRGYDDTPEKRRLFLVERDFMLRRWGATLVSDPAYNPNLTSEAEDFSLGWLLRAGGRRNERSR